VAELHHAPACLPAFLLQVVNKHSTRGQHEVRGARGLSAVGRVEASLWPRANIAFA
jgi:hypothetical protein